MKISGIILLLLTESSAEKNQASYAWNSTWNHPLDPNVHLLLKQGLKINYLPQNGSNGKSNIYLYLRKIENQKLIVWRMSTKRFLELESVKTQ